MTVRVSRYRELCSTCREPTEEVCFRCKTPLCPRHRPASEARCSGCESEYRRWPSREPRVVIVGVVLAMIWIGVTLALLEPAPPIAVFWALAFPVPVAVLAWRRLDSARTIFLRQEKREQSVADSRQIVF